MSQIDPQKEFYECGYQAPPVYRSKFARLNRVLPSLSRIDLAANLAPSRERILDMGCGAGDLLKNLVEKCEFLHGIDIAPVQIQRATRALAAFAARVDLQVRNIDTESLPFPDSFFDVVAAVAVIQFVFDPRHFLCEIYRVLKPNGTLILETNNVAYWFNRVRLLFGKRPQTSAFHGLDGNTLHYYTVESIRELFAMCGFEITKVCSAGRLAGLRSWWPQMFAQNVMVSARRKP